MPSHESHTSHTPHSRHPAYRRIGRRLLLAQESGLGLVIVLVMALLTTFSGDKNHRAFLRLDPAAPVVNALGPVITATTADGRTRDFPVADGWELRGTGPDAAMVRITQVNKFLNLENLVQVLVFASFIAIMAVGVTAVIVMGGIDLSIGSTYALAALLGAIALRYNWSRGTPGVSVGASRALWALLGIASVAFLVAGVVLSRRRHHVTDAKTGDLFRNAAWGCFAGAMALFLYVGWVLLAAMRDGWAAGERSNLPLWGSLGVALLFCCTVGGTAGLLNGVMVVGLRVHPFIITLGTMAAYRGLVALPTRANSVGDFPLSLQNFIKWDLGGVTPVPVLLMLAVALLGVLVMTRTVLGRRIFAIGGNEIAAAYAGIPVGKVKIVVYTLMGLLAGLSGFLYLGYFGAAESNAGQGYELKAIAAAVIGGASLSGGRGSALGAVLGAVLVGLIDNGILMLGIDQNYNQIILGAAIIIAVVLDQFKSRLIPQGR